MLPLLARPDRSSRRDRDAREGAAGRRRPAENGGTAGARGVIKGVRWRSVCVYRVGLLQFVEVHQLLCGLWSMAGPGRRRFYSRSLSLPVET